MLGRRLSAERGSPSRQGGGERLAARRRSKRHRTVFAFIVLFLLLCIAAIYGLRQDTVRISDIQVFGTDQSLAETAQAAMQGNYFGLVPRDSTFFFPASRIRADIITAHPDIAAVSIFRSGLTSLSIKVDNRFPVARWCPSTDSGQAANSTGPTTSPEAVGSTPSARCYFFDASGFIYATTSVNSTDSTNSPQADSPQAVQPVNPFIVYNPLAVADASSTPIKNPIGETLSNAEKLPATFDLARQFAALGSPVTSLVFRGDEVDAYLKSGTRVTYLLGDEQNAFTALTSARANFDLSDGSILYLDLRFSGKIYLKRK